MSLTLTALQYSLRRLIVETSNEVKLPVLRVRVRGSFGRELIEPICAHSKGLAALLRQKTLTREDVGILKDIGYAFEVEFVEVKL